MKIISMDVSSSVIGCCEWQMENKKLELKNIRSFILDSNKPLYERFYDFENNMRFQQYDLCIMEQRLKGFKSKFSSIDSLLSVSVANEIVSFIMGKIVKELHKFHPTSLRSKAGIKRIKGAKVNIKEVVIHFVLNNEVFKNYLYQKKLSAKDIFQTKEISKGKNKGKEEYMKGVNDAADSFVIGLGGLKVLNLI
jgi:hypothetical protein